MQIHNQKENITMAVLIKLNGVTIGTTTMTKQEIRNAEREGFTIIKTN